MQSTRDYLHFINSDLMDNLIKVSDAQHLSDDLQAFLPDQPRISEFKYSFTYNQVRDQESSYQNDEMGQIFPPEYDVNTMIEEHEYQRPPRFESHQPLESSFIDDTLLSVATEDAINKYQ